MNKVRIRWNDPAKGSQECLLDQEPLMIGRDDSNHIVLADTNVSSRHAMIEREGEQVVIRDVGSRNGVRLNGQRVTRSALLDGATVQIGSYTLHVVVERSMPIGEDATVIARRTTEDATVIGPRNGAIEDATVISPRRVPADGATVISPRRVPADDALVITAPLPSAPAERDMMELTPVGRAPSATPPLQTGIRPQAAVAESNWPPAAFSQQLVSMQALQGLGLPIATAEFATVGAGIGSFVWSDLLRVSGVPASAISAVGVNPVPYAHYKLLTRNSQIPDHERLRSNSESTPDNVWGWPGYAAREIWHDFSRGNLGGAFGTFWQIFGEPTLTDTYTPRIGDVFRAMDREMERIGWNQIYRNGRVRAIRKTDDDRYVIAYSTTQGGKGAGGRPQHALLVARYLHMATGYPAIQFLPDLQKYREQTGDFSSVVNAYEDHDHIYEHLRRHGGLVLIRGRGIVASRVIQRIFEERHHNKNIGIIHLLRSPTSEGHKYGKSQREVINHFEFQPFNWPRGCWTGYQRKQLERASPEERKQLLEAWGGTTTARRQDWVDITNQGLREGWYKIDFGDVTRVERNADGELVTVVKAKGQVSGELKYGADFIVDATGLDAKAKVNPLLRDLVEHYNLALNPLERIQVENDFEIGGMRNNGGHMYAVGAMTLGGPNAGVDTFLGLQYAAYRVVDSLRQHGAPGIKGLNGLRSVGQWIKWARGADP